jgi:aryl carrier-like protein
VTEVLSYPASRAQQQMWFIEQLVPDDPVFNLSFERRFAGPLDPATLRAAVADVIGRHESLRTRFVLRDNSLWQVVEAPPDEPPVAVTDLRDADDPEAAYRDLCSRVGGRVFDLGRAPLLRAVHVRLGPAADALIVVLHHVIADAVSIDIFNRDLAAAYEARAAGRAPDWPELPVQYADFTAWQEERANDSAVRQDLDYWRGQLADLSTVDLTHGRPWPEQLTPAGHLLEFTIEPGVVSALDEFARTERATAFMGLLAVYAATLGRVFGGEDVAVVSPVAGRPLPEVRDVIGMFVDQVVLRLDLSAGPTFRELVRAARRMVGEAHDHGSVTFDQVVSALAPERVAGMNPLAQAAINLQPPSAPRPPLDRMPRTTAVSRIDTGTATHDLLLDLVSYPEPYGATLRYRPDVVDDAAAELVCAVFQRLLRAVLAEPDRPLWTLEVLSPDELLRLRELASRRPDPPAAVPELEPAGPPEPATPVEEALLEGWRWLLPKAEFGVTDDFFDIGGDSILAIHAVAEARRHGLELTVRQILDLRTIRALAQALETRELVRRPAPLGISGPTVVRLPAAVTEAPDVPGVTVDGRLLSADPSQVDDWSLSRVVKAMNASFSAPGALNEAFIALPVETMDALRGPAHEAYATTTLELVAAAVLAATGGTAVTVADIRREEPVETGNNAVPGLLRVDPVAGDAELIRAVKTALRNPDADDPAVPGVRVLSLPDNVFVTETGNAGARVVVTLAGARLIVSGDDGLGERVRDHLVRLVEHCAAAEPAYSAADFPDAGLDDAGVAALLAGLDLGEVAP